jgi:proline iminopeptidase
MHVVRLRQDERKGTMSTATPSIESTTLLEPGNHQVTLNGIDLHYRISGSGPTLFLVPPGWGIGSSYLQRAFNFLQDRFRLVFIDTRGSGLSSRPADSAAMSSHDMADDLEALRTHLGLDEIHILGHSNSGAIALSYAERYPHRVSKLVVIGSQVLGLSAAQDTQAFLQARAEDPRYKTAVQTVSEMFTGKIDPSVSDAALEDFIAQILPLYFQSPEKNLAVAHQQLAGPIASYAFRAQNAADRSAKIDQTALLHQIQARALILCGRHDWICPLALSERLQIGIPNSRMVVFEESGHFPWLEEPEKLATELTKFLEE